MSISSSTFHFSTGVSALFEMSTANAQRILPGHLQPIEVRPQRSVLSVSAFHFSESEVGPHAQLVFSVIVPPMIESWKQFPKAGFFPFLAAASSDEARRYLCDVRRIPTWPHTIAADFIERADRIRIRMRAQGEPFVDVTVTEHTWQPSSHLLQTHMMDGERRLKADVRITGSYTMHEHEAGSMTLHPHPMNAAIALEELSPTPFREHWLKEGTECFAPLEVV